MPIAPRGSLLTFTDGVTSSTVAVSAIVSGPSYVKFKRDEFNNALLRNAPNTDGQQPIFNQTGSGKVFQYFSGCGTETVRPVAPNTLSNLDNILKRFDCRRYEIVGDVSIHSEVTKLYNFAKAHQSRLARFEFHLDAIRESVSYQDLVDYFQVETLDYLTSTSLSMSGFALADHTPETHCLITEFTMEPLYEISNNEAYSSATVYRTWRMKIERRAITNLRNTSWQGA